MCCIASVTQESQLTNCLLQTPPIPESPDVLWSRSNFCRHVSNSRNPRGGLSQTFCFPWAVFLLIHFIYIPVFVYLLLCGMYPGLNLSLPSSFTLLIYLYLALTQVDKSSHLILVRSEDFCIYGHPKYDMVLETFSGYEPLINMRLFVSVICSTRILKSYTANELCKRLKEDTSWEGRVEQAKAAHSFLVFIPDRETESKMSLNDFSFRINARKIWGIVTKEIMHSNYTIVNQNRSTYPTP